MAIVCPNVFRTERVGCQSVSFVTLFCHQIRIYSTALILNFGKSWQIALSLGRLCGNHLPRRATSPKSGQEIQGRRHRRSLEGRVRWPFLQVYFTDATHPTHNSTPAYGWIRRGKEKELVANSGRRRLNLHGALNTETHEVISLSADSINTAATVMLFERIEQAHPSAESIYVIADNAGCYHAGAVKEYLASGRSRIWLWFLPPYSPNLNLIERLWKFFRKKVLNIMAREFNTAI